MKIKCINNLGCINFLTVGGFYIAADVPRGTMGDRAYLLINDLGSPSSYSKEYFEVVVEPDEDLTTLEDTYLALLRLPICSWRTKNQMVYCNLRNRIADKTGKSIREIQEKYETLAYA